MDTSSLLVVSVVEFEEAILNVVVSASVSAVASASALAGTPTIYSRPNPASAPFVRVIVFGFLSVTTGMITVFAFVLCVLSPVLLCLCLMIVVLMIVMMMTMMMTVVRVINSGVASALEGKSAFYLHLRFAVLVSVAFVIPGEPVLAVMVTSVVFVPYLFLVVLNLLVVVAAAEAAVEAVFEMVVILSSLSSL